MAQKRRKAFHKHLLLFLGANLAAGALDVWQSPRLDWAYWVLIFWGMLFLFHFFGLRSRGYSLGELFTPVKTEAPREEEAAPFDFELIRSRQLRDGIVSAAEAVRKLDGQLANDAVAAADHLLTAVEELLTKTRERADAGTAKTEGRLKPELRAAVDLLDELHAGLIAVDVLEDAADQVPIQQAREQAEALRKL
ncbi:MAG: 2TM domain-containing protein [Gemmatimonadota bacterium]